MLPKMFRTKLPQGTRQEIGEKLPDIKPFLGG